MQSEKRDGYIMYQNSVLTRNSTEERGRPDSGRPKGEGINNITFE